MYCTRVWLWLPIIVIGLATPTVPAQEHPFLVMTPIALTGQPVAGTGKSIIALPANPILSQDGDAIFVAFLTGAIPTLIHAAPDGSLTPIVTRGEAACDGPSIVQNVSLPSLSGNRVAFYLLYSGNGGPGIKGVCTSLLGESLQSVVVIGDSINGAVVTDVGAPMVDSSGSVYLPLDFDDAALSGYYRWTPSTGLECWVRNYQHGYPVLDGYNKVGNGVPSAGGRFAYRGTGPVSSSECDYYADAGIYFRDAGGSIVKLAHAGDPILDSDDYFCRIFPGPRINANGIVSFLADIRGDFGGIERAIVRSWNEGIAQLVHDEHPSPIGEITHVISHSINDRNELVFDGYIGNHNALFRAELDLAGSGAANVSSVVLQEDDPAGARGATFRDVFLRAHNNCGEMIISGRVNPNQTDGLWLIGTNNAVGLIALEGHPFHVGPGDDRIVSEVDFNRNSDGDDGWRILNDDGDAVVRIRFTDGTEGIFRVRMIESCLGDVSGDGVVDLTDLRRVIAAFGYDYACNEDLNDDGVVDHHDLVIVARNLGACN